MAKKLTIEDLKNASGRTEEVTIPGIGVVVLRSPLTKCVIDSLVL